MASFFGEDNRVLLAALAANGFNFITKVHSGLSVVTFLREPDSRSHFPGQTFLAVGFNEEIWGPPKTGPVQMPRVHI